MRDLAGKAAVITGGASGIGRSLGLVLAREGMKIVLADVEEEALGNTVEEIRSRGSEAMGVVTDVTTFESVQELERRAVEAHGKVHVLCNNAGVGAHEDVPVWELPLSDWRWCMDVNVNGVIHGIKAFVPGMVAHGEEGHIINTSSGNGGLTIVPTTPIYSASKAAVSSITETLHLQLTMQGSALHAQVLYPGPNIVSSNIFTAWRNRLPRYKREVEQVAAPVTLEDIGEIYKSMGRDFDPTTPDEVAESTLEGIHADSYYILPWNEHHKAAFRARMEGVLEGKNPVPSF